MSGSPHLDMPTEPETKCLQDLRRRITSTISPWLAQKDSPPPFSLPILIVFALCMNDEPLADQQIFAWIFHSFAYYKTLGMTAVWNVLGDADGENDIQGQQPGLDLGGPEGKETGPGFDGALRMFQMPVSLSYDEDAGVGKWCVQHDEAALFLRARLWDERRKGVFRFLDLPPEARNRIYEMVLGFPTSGVQINLHDQDTSGILYTASRNYDEQFSFRAWEDPAPLLRVGKLSELLSILLVNRQVRNEALYVFTSMNTFYFSSPAHLKSTLRAMSPEHRDQMQCISFEYIADILAASSMRKAFAIMATMTGLKCLRIFIDQRKFFRTYYHRRDTDVSSLLHFHKARSISDRIEVILEGNFPDGLMEQIRAEGEDDREVVNVEGTEKATQTDLTRSTKWFDDEGIRLGRMIEDFISAILDTARALFGKLKSD